MGKIFLLKLSNRCRHQKVLKPAGFQLFNIDISNSNFQGNLARNRDFLFLTALCVEQDLVERLNHCIVIIKQLGSKDDFQTKS